MDDLLVRAATVVDGTGRPAHRADVTVTGARIVDITEPGTGGTARRVIDADGLTLAPGFIDLHSHADFTLPAFPQARNSLSQGVTSEVVGNCGWSPAPHSTDPGLARELRAVSGGIGPDLDWAWTDMASYLDRLDAARPAVNCLPLVGHTALRVAAMGMDPGAPTEMQAGVMWDGLRAALHAGAWGMSTGLVYPPSAFAATAEVHALAREVAASDGLYASHVRDEADHAVEAVEEAIATGAATGVRVQISHLKSAGPGNFGVVRRSLAAIAAARSSGLVVHCDVYPYEAVSTFLSQALPPWVLEGGIDALVGRLGSGEMRTRIAHDIEHGLPGWANLVRTLGGWSQVFVTRTASEHLAWARARWLTALAEERGMSPLDLAMWLLREDRGATVMIVFGLDAADVRSVVQAPFAAVGSDQLGVVSDTAAVHPRAYGSFARVLGPTVRDGTLPLEEAVRKMTSLPASIVGLRDRGTIAPGRVADLVLFEAATVRDEATYERPGALASGIRQVWLAGRVALDDGEAVDTRAGRVLRRDAGAVVRRRPSG